MPNHLHAIIVIDTIVETSRRDISKEEEMMPHVQNVETTHRVVCTSDNKCKDDPIGRLQETTGSVVSNKEETIPGVPDTPKLKANSLGSIVGQFKAVCTKKIHLQGCTDFEWQKGFYDRIIRNEKELYNIRKYIQQNPLKWEIEKDHLENLDL